MILYNRKKVKYRKDGYCWKKRKDGKTTREDHMKLKVQGVEVGEQTGVDLGGSWAGKQRLLGYVQCEVVHTFRKIFIFAKFQLFRPHSPKIYTCSLLLL